MVDDIVTFSQQPCAADAESIDLKYIPADEEAALRAKETHELIKNKSSEMERERLIRWEEEKIDKEERHIRSLERDRKSELSNLKRRQAYAANNLAGAVYHQSLSDEMQAVNQRYDALIAQRQASIERIRAEIDRMKMNK